MKHFSLSLIIGLSVLGPTAELATLSGLPSVQLELVAEGLNASFFLVALKDKSGHRIIGDQIGLAMVLMPDGKVLDTPFL